MWAARANQFMITPLLLFRKRIKGFTGESYISLFSLPPLFCFVSPRCFPFQGKPTYPQSVSHEFLLSSLFPCSSLDTHPPPTTTLFLLLCSRCSFIDICFPLILCTFSTWRPCEIWCTKTQLERVVASFIHSFIVISFSRVCFLGSVFFFWGDFLEALQ